MYVDIYTFSIPAKYYKINLNGWWVISKRLYWCTLYK